MNKITDRMRRELERLALLRDDEIDTIDLPEETAWHHGQRSRFSKATIQERGYDVRSIANWFYLEFRDRGRKLTNLDLNKLVYFAVERFLIERSVILTKAKIEAWAHGPVFREVYHALKEYGDKPILEEIKKYSISERKLVPASAVLEPYDVAFLKEISHTYGKLTTYQLVELSHRENEPWAAVWNYKGRTNPGMEISIEMILERAPKRRNFDVG